MWATGGRVGSGQVTRVDTTALHLPVFLTALDHGGCRSAARYDIITGGGAPE